jgi:sulfatase-modifying factor enzyme 1/FecR-like protein
MNLSVRFPLGSLMLGMACLFIHDLTGEETMVMTVEQVRVLSTTGSVAARTADGKTMAIVVSSVPSGEASITATQGAGSILATGGGSSAVVSIPGAGAFLIGPGTQVKLPKPEEKGHTLELLKGQLFFDISAEEIRKHGGATFRLKTPSALLAVKGTRFFASSLNGMDTAGVHQGTVDIYEPVSQQLVALNAGSAVPIKSGQIGKERPLAKDESAFQKNYDLIMSEAGNSLSMRFATVPGTNILMCIHETRKSDWAAFAAANRGVESSRKYPNQQSAVGDSSEGKSNPIACVSWEHAKAFCAWLSGKEGREYRLPTEEEWSLAAGKKLYPWGDRWPPPEGAGNFADSSTKRRYSNAPSIPGYTDGYIKTSPVMSFKPNKLGIYDLAGNVTEWCEDWYDETKTKKVLRGSSWLDGDARELQSIYRHGKEPTWESWDMVGFRIVLVLKGG